MGLLNTVGSRRIFPFLCKFQFPSLTSTFRTSPSVPPLSPLLSSTPPRYAVVLHNHHISHLDILLFHYCLQILTLPWIPKLFRPLLLRLPSTFSIHVFSVEFPWWWCSDRFVFHGEKLVWCYDVHLWVVDGCCRQWPVVDDVGCFIERSPQSFRIHPIPVFESHSI